VTFHLQGHVNEGRHKVIRSNETKRENRIRLKEDFKKLNKRKVFFSWKKDDDVKVNYIWLTEKTQGAAVENKTFVVRSRSINF
jgi:hypothetical protein